MTRKIILFFALLLGTTLCYEATAQTDASNLKINAKPADQWELGIHLGHTAITGDVDWKSSFGVGLHVRKSLDHIFSIRLDAGYYSFRGEEKENERQVDAFKYGFPDPVNWLPEYSSSLIGGDLTLIASLNQFKTNKKKKINPYLFAGGGVSSVSVTAKDGDREADVTDLPIFDDEWNISPYITAGAGIGFLISSKVSLTVEHKLTRVIGRGNDLIDAVEWNGSLGDRVITASSDLLHYTNVRIGIALGDKDKKSIPLWWASPLDMMSEDLAAVKARPILDLTDTDEDGVIDMIDQEPDTEKGCPVDTRGVILDSDMDGVTDCKDKEVYSPPGYEVNSDGVAQVPPPPSLNEDDVNRIVDAKLADWSVANPVKGGDWFLPMIHFDLDRYAIRRSEYGKLHNIATVMKLNPGLRVVAAGHTDKLAGNCYNDLLSFNRANAAIDYLVSKYGIARDRFILNWGGENANLVPTNGGNMMNRRVEFMVATTEADQGRPDCGVKKAGTGSASGYSGNKEAGY